MDFKIIEEKELNRLFIKIENIETTLGEISKKTDHPLTDRWLDNQEVCTLLYISRRKLQDMRDKKQIPFSKIGGKIYYKSTDIDDLLNKNYLRAI